MSSSTTQTGRPAENSQPSVRQAITSRCGDLAIQMLCGPMGLCAPGTAVELERVRCWSRTPWRSLSIETFASASVFGVAPWPTQRPISIGCVAQPRVRPADRLEAADQQRGPLELLDRQQPQRVSHDHRHPVPPAGRAEPSQHGGEGKQPQVGFRLAAAGREPQQVGELAVIRMRDSRFLPGRAG